MSGQSNRLVVAIDGPSGTGKSTVAKALAVACGAKYLNTGSMYRAVGLHALRRAVDLEDPAAMTEAARKAKIDVSVDPESETVWLDGEEVSAALRGDEVTQAASRNVGVVPSIRSLLVAEQQRIIAEHPRIVVEGRDIGTVVAPDADLKIFLTASEAARAERRTAQNQELRLSGTKAQILEQITQRDTFDASRKASPLRQAHDAVLIDTSGLSAEEALARLLTLAQAKGLA
ncbi:cytidylate kinase [Segniliparus rotundus DSM 44985]|uniref:Cytidylate kinase n=1 Tax=Segniliparus rotundus (strain ATCC BAA-972 / CDC 1076 / CIP 108378 / DSM 44985 / JCM 13578) TaxID=640132 RepID=D6ZFP4_SEGRD|nr:(d)CMP kinase [Segniliparus rotundus]ADG97768.1 cytidylate kinase [Segniliparus rotundus DSM 44985]